MQPSYLTTTTTTTVSKANASCTVWQYVLETCFTSHKNICKIVNQKIAQKIVHYIYNTTISFYDSMHHASY